MSQKTLAITVQQPPGQQRVGEPWDLGFGKGDILHVVGKAFYNHLNP